MKEATHVAIVGGGAAGLSAGWFLRKRGYHHVTVFEVADRIGGKCKSLTYKGRSFDLGANYITSSYTQVRRLARELGLEMFTERGGHAMNPDTGVLSSLVAATTARDGLIAVAWAAARYLFHRFRLRRSLAPYAPGFVAASRSPELCMPFDDWLKNHGLQALEPVFDIPITLMGYTKLSRVSTAYALTYMNPRTFLDLMLFALDPPLRRWPKRFDLGYERLLERMAAKVNVLRGAKIGHIERPRNPGDRITVEYELQATHLRGTRTYPHSGQFDALILACPLLPEVLCDFLTLTPAEEELFKQVELDPFVVTTYPTSCTTPIEAVSFMFPRPPHGHPYVVTRQFGDVPLLSIYSRIDKSGTVTRDDVLAHNRDLLKLMGAPDPTIPPYTYDEWPYFPHVPSTAVQDGFYLKLEALQGVDRTYYVGGLLAYELVETIVGYSRHIVDTHFGDAQ